MTLSKRRKLRYAAHSPLLFLLVALGGHVAMLRVPEQPPHAAQNKTAIVMTASLPQIPETPANQNSLPLSLVSPMLLEESPARVSEVRPKILSIKSTVVTSQPRLLIPRINVDAVVQQMGMTMAGAMDLPDSTVDVGWYGPGTRPGNVGSAVIGGHNRWGHGDAVFAKLHELQKGDTVSVLDATGVAKAFVVRETRTFAATDDATVIFQSDDGTHLNLITCAGVWDAATGSYTQRLVVFTDAT